jgi:hypothetical protein
MKPTEKLKYSKFALLDWLAGLVLGLKVLAVCTKRTPAQFSCHSAE